MIDEIAIVPFRREHAADFRRLNLDWIERLFSVEDADRKVLDDPESAIVAAGGQVFFAIEDGKAVGTVALVRTGASRYELAKMAVAPSHQRRGVGELLGRACIDWARQAGASLVFLQSNRRLDGALRLYQRLGFREAVDPERSEYARCDIYMELPIGRSGG
jgi:GNAT superfamily N-acetyltransferase